MAKNKYLFYACYKNGHNGGVYYDGKKTAQEAKDDLLKLVSTYLTNDVVFMGAKVIIYFSLIAIFIIGLAINAFFIKDLFSVNSLIEYVFALCLVTMLSIISIPVAQIKKIKAGGYNYSFGTLSQTHLVIIGWSDSKFDRTVYIPVTEIESMELGKNATSKHGTVIVHIKERSKPLVTNDIVEPQKLIDIFNNLETFVESPYGK